MREMSDGRELRIQDRDVAFLQGLFESRVMTLAHASTLFFGGKPEAAKKRVQKLKAAGYVRERPRHTYEPSVLFLTAPADAVRQRPLVRERGDRAKGRGGAVLPPCNV